MSDFGPSKGRPWWSLTCWVGLARYGMFYPSGWAVSSYSGSDPQASKLPRSKSAQRPTELRDHYGQPLFSCCIYHTYFSYVSNLSSKSYRRFDMRCRFNSVDAADYTPPQRRAAAAASSSSSSTAAVKGRAGTAAAAAGATSGSGSLVAPLISIDMCRCGNGWGCGYGLRECCDRFGHGQPKESQSTFLR